MQKMTGVATRDAQSILNNIEEISVGFASKRAKRQRQRKLVQADFDLLRDAGYLMTAVPVEFGGIWENDVLSTRPICEILRTLAHGDSSIALVASMHPAVIRSTGWLTVPKAPQPHTDAWERQRRWAFQTVTDGHFWGTIISEPGSGGDNTKSNSVAKRTNSEGQYLLTGQKHFGSGSGMTSYMITQAIPEGETNPDTFVLDMLDVPWDGSAGVKLIAPWDGHGMIATQSHGMAFEHFPVTRLAFPGDERQEIQARMDLTGGPLFVAVITGIVETAIETARHQLERKLHTMRPFEQVEWARVEIESWLIQQAYRGMLRSIEDDQDKSRNSLLAKEAVADLAESVMLRLSKVVGGSAYSRHMPYGFWLEDVRALGFLRPPWGWAFEQVFEGSWNN